LASIFYNKNVQITTKGSIKRKLVEKIKYQLEILDDTVKLIKKPIHHQQMLNLIQLYPILMKIILFSIIVLCIYNFKSFLKLFKLIKGRTWLLLILIFLCGLTLRVMFIPHTHYVYYDEFEHINLAQNILYSNKFCECYSGTNQDCNSCYLMPYPAGYHTFLSLIFNIFGDSEQVAFNTNAIVGSISIILFFLLLFLITKNSRLALIGAFIFSFIPVHLKYSGTSSLGIFSVFFIILNMMFLETYIKTKKYSIFLLFLTTLLFAIQIRGENLLLLFIFSFYLLIRLRPSHIKDSNKIKYLFTIFIFLLMLIPFIQLIYFGSNVLHAPGWDDNLSTKINYFKNQIIPNILFFINFKFNSIIFLPLCVIGGIRLYFKDKRQLFYLVLFFLLFLSMYSSYHIGNLLTFGDTIRYSLVLYIPLIIILINGIEFIFKTVHLNKKILVPLILLVFLISLIPTINFILSKNTRFETQYNFILSMKDKLPGDTYIISYNPTAIISTIHKKSITPHHFMENWELIEQKNNIILFKDFWWYEKEEELNKIESKLMEYYSFKLIKENNGYSFYNLTLKTAANPISDIKDFHSKSKTQPPQWAG